MGGAQIGWTMDRGMGAPWSRHGARILSRQCISRQQPIGKGRVRGRGREGMGADFMFYIHILWSMGNPMPELSLTTFIAGFN